MENAQQKDDKQHHLVEEADMDREPDTKPRKQSQKNDGQNSVYHRG